MSRVRIVGLGGSLAEYSTSLSALNVALEGARDYGADVRLFDLRELNLPMFVPGAGHAPTAALRCAMRSLRPRESCGAVRCTTVRSAARSRTRSIGSNC